jgi:hypothetical protein
MSIQYSDSILTAVLYSTEDAQRFLSEFPKVDRVFALTPDARAEVKNVQLPLLTTLEVYSDYDHRCVLARVRRMERKLKGSIRHMEELNIAARETLRGQLHLLAAFSSRLWETLKGTGSWLIPAPHGWKEIGDLHEAHRALLVHISSQTPTVSVGVDRSLWSPIIRILNRVLLKIIKKQQIVLMTGYAHGLTSLSQKLNQVHSHLSTIAVSGSIGKFREVLIVLLSIFRTITGQTKRTYYKAVPTYSESKTKAVERYLFSISDPVIQNAVDLLKQGLIQDVVLTDGLNKEIDLLVKSIQPKAVWAHALRWGSHAMLGEVSLRYKVPCTLISHGSHTKPENITSAFEYRELAQGLLISPLASNSLLQSPHAERAIYSFEESSPFSRSYPIMWGYRQIPSVPKDDSIRTILHAGTYKRWDRTRPWIYETSDEFVEGLTTLIQAIQHLERTKLIIRVRPMPECQIKSLKQLLPQSDCYEIKTSGEFLKDLASADLLISYASTTTEEALYARCPVLLWGGSRRHLHLPASKVNPTENSRNAVYAPETKEKLLSMLKAILECHVEKSLTDDELKEHIWLNDVPGKKELIQQLVG